MTENRKRVSVTVTGQQRSVSIRAPAQAVAKAVTVKPLPVRSSRHAETAERLKTPRRIAVVGDVLGDTLFDGSEDVAIGTAVEVMTTMEIDALLESAMTLGG